MVSFSQKSEVVSLSDKITKALPGALRSRGVEEISAPNSFQNAPTILLLSRRHRILSIFKINNNTFLSVMSVTDFMCAMQWLIFVLTDFCFQENTRFSIGLVLSASPIRLCLNCFLKKLSKLILQNSLWYCILWTINKENQG